MDGTYDGVKFRTTRRHPTFSLHGSVDSQVRGGASDVDWPLEHRVGVLSDMLVYTADHARLLVKVGSDTKRVVDQVVREKRELAKTGALESSTKGL